MSFKPIKVGRTKYIPAGAVVEFTRFADNHAICIMLKPGDEPAVRCSVNGDFDLDKGQTIIKDWSENRGVLHALTEVGVVTPTGRLVDCGYAQGAVVDVNPKLMKRFPKIEGDKK